MRPCLEVTILNMTSQLDSKTIRNLRVTVEAKRVRINGSTRLTNLLNELVRVKSTQPVGPI